MMILLFFLLSIVIAGVVATVKSRQAAHWQPVIMAYRSCLLPLL